MDPATLLVDVNVRPDLRLNADFVASIKQHGVLQPVVALVTAEGALRVRYGRRRTLAAFEARFGKGDYAQIESPTTDGPPQLIELTGAHHVRRN